VIEVVEEDEESNGKEYDCSYRRTHTGTNRWSYICSAAGCCWYGLVGRLSRWTACWLTGRPRERLARRAAGCRLGGWCTRRLTGRLSGRPMRWPARWLGRWSTRRLTCWPI
jgi:hypothetical protein